MPKNQEPLDDDYDDDDADYVVSKTPRWLAAGVLCAAFFGFVGLAYYAYNAGTRSVAEDDLLVVQADDSPVKEKPADPGGMKFPNQDKTIFDAVSGNAKPAGAERVMPAPEQPIAEVKDTTQDTKAWVNEKLDEAKAEPKPSGIEAKLAAANPAAGEADTKPMDEVVEVPSAPVAEKAVPVVKDVVKDVPKEAPPEKKVELKKAEPAPVKAEKAEKPKTTEAKPTRAPSGGSMVQLGAYRSEAEAKAAWKKHQGAVKELASLSPSIQKAEVEGKGTFYRLRASAADAKALCQKLTAKGQPCMVVK